MRRAFLASLLAASAAVAQGPTALLPAVPLTPSPAEVTLSAPPPVATVYEAGDGLTVSMLNGESKLKLFAQFSAIGQAATTRPFPAGGTLFLLPPSATGARTNTFDVHARQTAFGASLSGPEVMGFTPGAYFLGFIQNDNLTSDAYGFLPFNAYGELKNERWRFAAGLMNDVFNPVKPTMISLLNLFASGNTGSFRGQMRAENYFKPDDAFQLTTQFSIGEPVASVLSSNRVIEDNGWPNVEGRIATGLGVVTPLAGGRKQRAVEFGASGLIGQMRSASVTSAAGGLPLRSTIDVWGLGADAQVAITDHFGVSGEFFTGQGLGEYSGGIGQTFGNNLRAIRTTGGWGEAYYYLTDSLHLHAGYGLDTAARGDLNAGQLVRNQTYYTNLVWDVSKVLQVSFEVDYRKTSFVGLRDAEGVLFISQFLWRF